MAECANVSIERTVVCGECDARRGGKSCRRSGRNTSVAQALTSARPTERTDADVILVSVDRLVGNADPAAGPVARTARTLKKRGSGMAPEPSTRPCGRRDLLQLALDARERRSQLRADAVHDADDGDRNAGCDKPVLDGRRAGVVTHELRKQALHLSHSLGPSHDRPLIGHAIAEWPWLRGADQPLHAGRCG